MKNHVYQDKKVANLSLQKRLFQISYCLLFNGLTAVKVSNPAEVNKPCARCEFRGGN